MPKPGSVRLPAPQKQPVEVLWLDAALNEDRSAGMILMRTIGYFTDKNRREIQLCSDLEDTTLEPRTFHVIPRVHIRAFTPLLNA